MTIMAAAIMPRCQVHSKDLHLPVRLCQAISRSMACPCGNVSVHD